MVINGRIFSNKLKSEYKAHSYDLVLFDKTGFLISASKYFCVRDNKKESSFNPLSLNFFGPI
jgi:hypothetical protein